MTDARKKLVSAVAVWAAVATAACLVLGSAVWMIGSSNPETPAGYVGYLTRGAVFGQSRFVATQQGQTSPGKGWMLHVVNVSITPYTFTESFDKESSVLAKDNLKLTFQVHIGFRIRQDKVKDFVERFSTLHEGEKPDEVVEAAYHNYLMEPLRNYARDEVQRMNGLDVKDNLTPIGDAIMKRILLKTADTPFEVSGVVVGNIQYPAAVADAVSLKLAATQQAERVQNEVKISEAEAQKAVAVADGEAKARIATANGEAQAILAVAKAQADANNLLQRSLTPQLVEYNKVDKWDGKLPQVSGGTPLISFTPKQ